ncbi:oligosaccharide flippase family protein [Altibacter sp. HG106]|uniref:oligosaccharide flippase family protein n=1 Tax=Altibacter sp. HG106 TaxID=3023937 RepID=UPI002350F02C|nr:oligosaccharide flippase family protein [Altibacter sp. HG106]MDC7995363.1 oligosaccharide flippase family protein [Altibacter sp. HG106]
MKLFSRKDIKTASVSSIAIKFGAAFFTFLNGILLARILTVEHFGYYILALTTITLLSVPITAGLPNLITRYVSKYEVHDNYDAIKGLLIKSHQYAGIAILVVAAISGLLYVVWWKNLDTVLVETVALAFLLLPLLGINALRTAFLRGMKLILMSELPDTLFRNLLLTAALVICWAFNMNLTPQDAMLLQVGAAFAGFVLGYVFLHRSLLRKLASVTPIFNTKEWIKETIPFTVNSGIQMVKTRLLTYVLAIFGSVEAVALFEIAWRGSSLVSFTLDALNRAIAPFVSSAYERDQRASLQRIVKKTGRIIFACSLPIALVFMLGGTTLLGYVFGAAYEASYWALFIMCVGQLFSAMTGSVGLLLNMTGNQGVFSKNNLIFLIVNVIISIPSILLYDLEGAAFVYSVILVLQNIILWRYVKKHLNINTAII